MNDLKILFAACDRHSLSGVRDLAIFHLLIEQSLKRQQISSINIDDFHYPSQSLQVIPPYQLKTQPSQRKTISLSLDTTVAIKEWLNLIHFRTDDAFPNANPLFISLDRANYGHRLTGTAIYNIVKMAIAKAGLDKKITPDQLRHYPIQSISNQELDSLNRTQNKIDETIIRLNTLDISPPTTFTEFSPDLLSLWLTNKRSLNTRRAYEKDLQDFFNTAFGQPPNEIAIAHFLQLNRFDAIAIVLQYKSHLITKQLKEATINRRLSALKAIVNYAAKLGKCNWNLDDIQTESIQTYRDTTGIKPEGIRQMLLHIDRSKLKGIRDFAILRLLWDNALRRNEIVSANISDFDYAERSLKILGKGRGSQKSLISLTVGTANAIQDWLSHSEKQKNLPPRSESKEAQPLFHSLDRASYGHRLTGTAIYQIINQLAQAVGIPKKMSPHRIRHSAITAALDATNGNIRKVQKLSRHKKIDTLMLYDDNRTNMQGEVSDLLGDLI
jgi:integrase/recombinase XerC